jgi:hypothetical protein
MTKIDMVRLGLGSIIKFYKTFWKMLSTVYADYGWLPWKFKFVPKKMYQDPKVIEKVVQYIESELQIVQNEDWYRVSKEQLNHLQIRGFVRQFGSLHELLVKVRPLYAWDKSKFITWRTDKS